MIVRCKVAKMEDKTFISIGKYHKLVQKEYRISCDWEIAILWEFYKRSKFDYTEYRIWKKPESFQKLRHSSLGF